MDRLDLLGKGKRERLAAMSGGVLSPGLDAELQGIVTEAAAATQSPIGLVSLVLDHTQFFRAHVGLPPELAATRSTDRDVSFCQFVVQTEAAFEVGDAPSDPRVPQQLAKDFGVRAYLGFPVVIGSHVVGSLCVIDVKQRSFTEAERASMSNLANATSRRLGALAQPAEGAEVAALMSRAAEPLFGEFRNVLAPLRVYLGVARASLLELDAVRSLAALVLEDPAAAQRAAAVLQSTPAVFADLQESFQVIDDAGRRLDAGVLALEALHLPMSSPARLARIVSAAGQLALHHTKLVGGVAWGTVPSVAVEGSSQLAVALVATALRDVPPPIAPRYEERDGWISVRFHDPAAVLHCGAAGAFVDTQSARVFAEGTDLVLSFRLARVPA